jgi:hypothetical protein
MDAGTRRIAIHFAFGGPTRAVSASRGLAAELKLPR